VLQTINGQALPATAAEGGGQRYVVTADSLVFDATGHVRRSFTVRWLSTSPRLLDTTYHQSLLFPYSIERDHLTIGSQARCPANANCVGWDEGTINEAVVRLADRVLWSGEPDFLFARR
jgi:hypothetical protein